MKWKQQKKVNLRKKVLFFKFIIKKKNLLLLFFFFYWLRENANVDTEVQYQQRLKQCRAQYSNEN